MLRGAALVLVAAMMIASCGVSSSGTPVPPPPSDFAVGATIPGWVLLPADGGAGEIAALGNHDGARWNVILSRPMKTRPRDFWFSLAVADNGLSHAGVASVHFTSDPTATAGGNTVVSRRVANGHITPDGATLPGEWNLADATFLVTTPQNELPTGMYPPATTDIVIVGSAYDDDYVYFFVRWGDGTVSQSDRGPVLQWDGTQFVPRVHAANDTNGNGLLDVGETMVVSADRENEDRLMMFFPIHDSDGAFLEGGQGCAASCHTHTPLDPTGGEAVHSWTNADDLSDVWVWRAAATGPARRVDERVLGVGVPGAGKSQGGSGFMNDAGVAPFFELAPPSPSHMFDQTTFVFQPLHTQALDFGPGTIPGAPVIPTIQPNAQAFDVANFNGSGNAPNTWNGVPPMFFNDYLPAFAQQSATDGRSDVEAVGSYNAGVWTVELRRRRVVRDATGAVRADDFLFDDDADFFARALEQLQASQGLPFSVAVTDRGRGHDQGESRYAGPLRLSADPTLSGTQTADVALHDYGPGFTPASPADFTDPRVTVPQLTGGGDVALRVKAGTDGGQNLFVLVSWDDDQPDTARDGWSYDGFFWTQSGDEDELRILFDHTVDPGLFAQGGGCAIFCHGGGGPFGAPAVPHFSSSAINQLGDLWHWRAGRSAPLGRADDGYVDHFFDELFQGASGAAAVHADTGTGPLAFNFSPTRDYPVFMSPSDPNALAAFLSNGVMGLPDAVEFVDVAAGLPPPMVTPGGAVSFAQHVLPIFEATCNDCHPDDGGLDLSSWDAVMAGGNSGGVIVPGSSIQSLLVQRLTGVVLPIMPVGFSLPQGDIQLIIDWIDQGAQDN